VEDNAALLEAGAQPFQLLSVQWKNGTGTINEQLMRGFEDVPPGYGKM
jgi:hypothetical protein